MPDDDDRPRALEDLQLLISNQIQPLRVHAREGTNLFIVLTRPPAPG
jgi:hypothetical protein